MARGLRVSAALVVLAALAAGADAGSAVAWLEGGDAPSQPPPRSHAGRHGASPHELDALRRRLVPAKGGEDMRDLEDARDASSCSEAGGVDAGPDGAPRQKTLSAGGGSAFATAPPAADTEDFARRVRASKGEAIVLHGGLVEGGDTASRTAVLAGLGSAEGLVFCELASGPSDGSGRTMARASPAVAV